MTQEKIESIFFFFQYKVQHPFVFYLNFASKRNINVGFNIPVMWTVPSGFYYTNQVMFMLINKQFQFCLFITHAPNIGV